MVMLLVFILAALLGALLLSAALVVWLVEVAMPLPWALLVVGAAWSVVAVVVYSCSLRASMARLRSRLDVIYKVSAAFDMVYNRVLAFVSNIFKGA
jgi:hypothetical protein